MVFSPLLIAVAVFEFSLLTFTFPSPTQRDAKRSDLELLRSILLKPFFLSFLWVPPHGQCSGIGLSVWVYCECRIVPFTNAASNSLDLLFFQPSRTIFCVALRSLRHGSTPGYALPYSFPRILQVCFIPLLCLNPLSTFKRIMLFLAGRPKIPFFEF